ncbi:acyl-CoA dehydrogenase family protein, partial [Mycobacterium sp. E3298]|uniref:acyl-CoA dehydrogenase family protein n=1 Tax=Mycobacterium sp. E3298 TaxID=1856865 RepID=UPI000A893860
MVATVTDEQFAARALVRDWARNSTSGPGGTTAIREVEQGDADAWRPVFARLAELGIFGVAIAEEHGGADGSVEDLCAMVEEAAKALVPGPVATTALATLVVTDPELLAALAAGERFAGLALEGDAQFDGQRASGTLPLVLGAADGGVLLLPAGDEWLLVDTESDGVQVERLEATDFSRPLARVVLTSAPAAVVSESRRRVDELAATVLAAEAAGLTRWALDTAVDYAKVREQFGKPIGSFQAVKHLCAEMLCRAEQTEVAAADAARAAAEPDPDQFAIAAALAASIGITAAKANLKDCIQVLGGIGCTWEHDAHLYLRRAHAIGRFLGGAERW